MGRNQGGEGAGGVRRPEGTAGTSTVHCLLHDRRIQSVQLIKESSPLVGDFAEVYIWLVLSFGPDERCQSAETLVSGEDSLLQTSECKNEHCAKEDAHFGPIRTFRLDHHPRSCVSSEHTGLF